MEIRTCGNRIYTNLRGNLHVGIHTSLPEDSWECESFTLTSINSLLIYENKYCLQVYLDSCAFNTVNTEMLDYLEDNIF